MCTPPMGGTGTRTKKGGPPGGKKKKKVKMKTQTGRLKKKKRQLATNGAKTGDKLGCFCSWEKATGPNTPGAQHQQSHRWGTHPKKKGGVGTTKPWDPGRFGKKKGEGGGNKIFFGKKKKKKKERGVEKKNGQNKNQGGEGAQNNKKVVTRGG